MEPDKVETSLRSLYRKLSALGAERNDDVADYAHDIVVQLTRQGRDVQQWLGYIYNAVCKRIRYRREQGRMVEQQSVSLDSILNLPAPDVPLNMLIDLRHAIELLPEQQRQRVTAYYFEGYTEKEIAKLQGVSQAAVHYSLTNALIALRKRLDAPKSTRKALRSIDHRWGEP